MGLEGLVLKNVNGIYEPGKRHWLKVKKDYLFDGKMADAADLLVLGAWFGTGKKGGMLSIYLMGCQDTRTKVWKTVTKVHTGFDDNTMDKIHVSTNNYCCNALYILYLTFFLLMWVKLSKLSFFGNQILKRFNRRLSYKGKYRKFQHV